MNQVATHAYIHGTNTHHTGAYDDFWTRFKKNLRIELLAAGAFFLFLIRLIMVSGIGLFLWFFPFAISFLKEVSVEYPKTIGRLIEGLGLIAVYGIIYIIVRYLTLLPTYAVIPLLFLPKKVAFPIIGLAVFFSFFMVFSL